MQCNKRMLKTAGDHCFSNKTGLAAMDTQGEPLQPLFLMISPLLLHKFQLSTTVHKEGHLEETMSFEQSKDEAPKLQCLLCAYLPVSHAHTKLNLSLLSTTPRSHIVSCPPRELFFLLKGYGR